MVSLHQEFHLSPPPRRRVVSHFVGRPRLSILVCLIFIACSGFGLRWFEKDPSYEAFLSKTHPTVVARDKAKALFDIEDPIIVSLSARDGSTVFSPDRLSALRSLTEAIKSLPGVQGADVKSLATETSINGNQGDLLVDEIVPSGVLTEKEAQMAWTRARAMPPLVDILFSEKGDAFLIVVPVEDPDHAVESYDAIVSLTRETDLSGVDFHVAGVAAMNSRLATMISQDTRRLLPFAVLIVLSVVYLAVRDWRALVGPLIVIVGSAAMAVGAMGWLGAKYYMVTTALPVVIMAISVADSLHISVRYLADRKANPHWSAAEAACNAVSATWLPVTLTSLTTIAGFIGLALGSEIKPIKEFALFAAVGVAAAWFLSLLVIPACLKLLKVPPSNANAMRGRFDPIGWVTRNVAASTFENPRKSLSVAAITSALLVVIGFGVQFDNGIKILFKSNDPLRSSNEAVNTLFAGTSNLDILVSSPEPFGLITEEAMLALSGLTKQLEPIDHVNKVTSVADYISLMHQHLTTSDPGTLPTEKNAAAQYMLLYESSGDPTDFEQLIDYDYQHALVRAYLDEDTYLGTMNAVESFREIAKQWSKETGLKAELSGRIAVTNGWMSNLKIGHIKGLAFSIALVFLAALIFLRSFKSALIAIIPVATGVGLIHAVMAISGIYVQTATSMCAAIATGLGVDFGIHLVEALRGNKGKSISELFSEKGAYAVAARACVFSAAALGLGLSAVILSSAPAVQWYGLLIATGSLGSLIGSLIFVPAAFGLAYQQSK